MKWFVCFLGLLSAVKSITREEFFPFGPSADDDLLEAGNDRNLLLHLEKPLLYYDGVFNDIFINSNGFIATSEPTDESTYLDKMPPSFGMIAALQGDLDTSDGVGKVYYRQESEPATLRQAAEHINRAFPKDDEVNPTHVVVVTWVDVAHHELYTRGDGGIKKRNTFQLVLASLETASYAILFYERKGIQFFSTPVEGSSVVMHAGFSKGLVRRFLFSTQGQYYRTSGDDEPSVRALAEETNSGLRGVWVYRIGTSSYFSDVAPGEVTDLPTEAPTQIPDPRRQKYTDEQVKYSPYDPEAGQVQIVPNQYQPHQPDNSEVVVVDDTDLNVDVFSYNLGTCANNKNKCSQFADCRDYSSGYCCHCRPGFYGNGIQCVADGIPQRMNGKVYGKVFVGNSPSPVEFSSNDLHSYVVVNEGRSYIAISEIPTSVGPSLSPLAGLGGGIGWAFALEQPGYKNGFSIIGGEFTREAEVTFLPGNEKLIIKQEFKGTDELDYLVVSTTLDGRVPEVPLGSTVQIDPYSEVYQYNDNSITSLSTREYVVNMPDGTSETRTYQWRQKFNFQSCQHGDVMKDVKPSQMLNVDQVFVLYDANNELIRFAMSNRIGDVNGGQLDDNPCFTGRHGCDTNAVCRSGQGNQFKCECSAGFTGNGRTCIDIDECREDPQVCGPNSICNNQPGTFRCECRDGFQFGSDGRTCIEADRAVNHCEEGTHDCDSPERAQCSYTGGSVYICSCLPGFYGDGRICQDRDECQPGRCDPNAECINTQGSFICQCRAGYRGDGFYCTSDRGKTRCETARDEAFSTTEFGPRGPRPVDRYVPTCDENGEYEPLQCHADAGYCWCVDQYGQEVSGTRSGVNNRPMCLPHGGIRPPLRPTPRPNVDAPLPGTYLLFAQSGRIEHVPLEGYEMKKDSAKAVLHLPEKIIIGVAYDCVEKMVYWTEITSPSISKASLQGGEPSALIRKDLGSPEGIAIDHLGRTVFWTDSLRDSIEVASLDGSQRRVIINSDLVNPRAIITDPVNGNLYWTDWNREAPKIETSYMDGTNRRVLVKDGLGLPNGLTFDSHSSLLCWADAGTHKMECVHPGHGDRRKVLEGVLYPFGITSLGRNVYYTDWKREAVVSVDRYAGRESDEFQPQKRTKLYGITAAYSQCPSGQNYCSVNNGGCTHLCLATPNGRSCKCPKNAREVGCVEREGGY